jgi:hypothetical protein
MRILRAAGLLLVGWYLLLPPVAPGTQQLDKDAPLSHWKVKRTYATKRTCEGARDRLRRQGENGSATKIKAGKKYDPDLSCVICNAQCVSKDPRLQEK